LNATAANPSIPITPLTTRITGEIRSRLVMSRPSRHYRPR
jgi:hypothetical protein